MKLDLDIIDCFGGQLVENNNLLFKVNEDVFTIFYHSDLSQVKSKPFYLFANPLKNQVFIKAFVFTSILDAIDFYIKKGRDFFYYSIIIICDIDSKKIAFDFIKSNAIHELHFFYRKKKLDLFFLYLDLLERNINYSIINKNQFKVSYNSKEFDFEINDLKPYKIRKILGINDRLFKIKNVYLSSETPYLKW